MIHTLVLGTRGMLGQTIVGVLSRSRSLVLHGTSREAGGHGLRFDVEREEDSLRRLFVEAGPVRYVINCIGVRSDQIDESRPGSIARAIRVNALFPHRLWEAAAECGASVIHISTDGVFSPGADVCDEAASCDAADAYGKTKSLGEVVLSGFLTLRCSIVGVDELTRRGLLEWFRSQPPSARVNGYTDHLWNGVTTLQLAELCRTLIEEDIFDVARSEGPIHHFCPNARLSKHELLELFRTHFRPDLTVEPVRGPVPAVRRILTTRYRTLRDRFGASRPMAEAVRELAAYAADRR